MLSCTLWFATLFFIFVYHKNILKITKCSHSTYFHYADIPLRRKNIWSHYAKKHIWVKKSWTLLIPHCRSSNILKHVSSEKIKQLWLFVNLIIVKNRNEGSVSIAMTKVQKLTLIFFHKLKIIVEFNFKPLRPPTKFIWGTLPTKGIFGAIEQNYFRLNGTSM